MVKNYPELFTNLSAFKLRFQLKEQLQVVYKSRDKQGRRIFIFRAGIQKSYDVFNQKCYKILTNVGRWNPKECSLDDIFRCNLFCLQQLASNLDSQINGIVAIVDLENLGLHQARHFTPSYAKKIADLLIVRIFLTIWEICKSSEESLNSTSCRNYMLCKICRFWSRILDEKRTNFKSRFANL